MPQCMHRLLDEVFLLVHSFEGGMRFKYCLIFQRNGINLETIVQLQCSLGPIPYGLEHRCISAHHANML